RTDRRNEEPDPVFAIRAGHSQRPTHLGSEAGGVHAQPPPPELAPALPQKLGQHFLTNAGILERIAVAVCPAGEDLVIEIGPGRGALTENLLRRAARVVAIEIDATLVEHLRTKFADEPRLEI